MRALLAELRCVVELYHARYVSVPILTPAHYSQPVTKQLRDVL